MKPAAITALVDEGFTLRTEIETRKARLKKIEEDLRTHAEANPDDHVPLKDPDREGTRCILAGTEKSMSVVFTADAIMLCIPDKSEALIDITTLAAGHIKEFYRRTVTWDAVHVKSNKFDGKAFRAEARRLIPTPEEFIAACVRKNKDGIPVSQTKMEWDDGEKAQTLKS